MFPLVIFDLHFRQFKKKTLTNDAEFGSFIIMFNRLKDCVADEQLRIVFFSDEFESVERKS